MDEQAAKEGKLEKSESSMPALNTVNTLTRERTNFKKFIRGHTKLQLSEGAEVPEEGAVDSAHVLMVTRAVMRVLEQGMGGDPADLGPRASLRLWGVAQDTAAWMLKGRNESPAPGSLTAESLEGLVGADARTELKHALLTAYFSAWSAATGGGEEEEEEESEEGRE